MLGVATVHWRYGELAATNPRARSVSHKACGCRAETRGKESSTVKTCAPEMAISGARTPGARIVDSSTLIITSPAVIRL